MQSCISKGYVFQMEMMVRARQFGFSIDEVSSYSYFISSVMTSALDFFIKTIVTQMFGMWDRVF